jgi:ParB family transcriptional regulator, chromosome partitioning protein
MNPSRSIFMPPHHSATPATKPLDWFIEGLNARKIVVDDALHELNLSLRDGQLQPVGALDNGTLIFGFRRLAAARLGGILNLSVLIYASTLTPTEIAVITATENFQRLDLTAYEEYLVCSELMKLNPGWQQKDLAAHLHKNTATISRILAASSCVPEVLKALEAGSIGQKAVYEISRLPHDQQPALLQIKLQGGSVAEVASSGRKARSSSNGTPRVISGKVKVRLTSGAVLTLSGRDYDMAEVVEDLTAVLKDAKRALDKPWDVKTWMAVMRDQAAAG